MFISLLSNKRKLVAPVSLISKYLAGIVDSTVAVPTTDRTLLHLLHCKQIIPLTELSSNAGGDTSY